MTIGSLTVSGNAGVNTTAPLLPTDLNYVNNYLNPLSQPALDAANTYITNFRQGNATVSTGFSQGTSVTVKMLRNGFNFGGTVSGTTISDSVNMLNVSNPAITTQQGQFQSFINQYFNTIVPSNAGKWSSDEATQNSVTMQLIDQQLNYAKTHNMDVRMHNLLWGQQQQATFANNLVNTALGRVRSGNGENKPFDRDHEPYQLLCVGNQFEHQRVDALRHRGSPWRGLLASRRA